MLAHKDVFLVTFTDLKSEYISIQSKGTDEETLTRVTIDEVDDSVNLSVKPVFDEFGQVFILTRGRESFYLDLEGNYDAICGGQIQWSMPPSMVAIARPYIVAFMDAASTIEIKPLAHANKA